MRLLLIGIATLSGTLGAAAQSTAPATPATNTGLSFEVASIRRNVSGEQNASVRAQPGGRLTITNNTLYNIIRNAYGVQRYQFVPGVRVLSWIDSDRWDIVAKAPDAASQQQMMVMLQNLVAERFKLAIRRETRELPVYALVLTRPDGTLGPQLRRSTVDCAAIAAARAGGAPPAPPVANAPFCGTRTSGGSVTTSGVPLADFARNLAPMAGRYVMDKTGLTGPFDLELKWTPDQGAAAPNDIADAPSLFTAIQEQLGLKLESQRGPVDVLVIDGAERPTED